MICEHLRPVERLLANDGAVETYRGRPWSRNCREWVYYDRVLDLGGLRSRLALPEFVKDHEVLGPHEGAERGLVCSRCLDGVMGRHPDARQPDRLS